VTNPRLRCPVCSRRTAVSFVGERLARHKHDGEWCKGSGLTTLGATIVLAKTMATQGGPSHG
jgi:hypothetical protein